MITWHNRNRNRSKTRVYPDGKHRNIRKSTVQSSVKQTRKEESLCTFVYKKVKNVCTVLKIVVRMCAHALIWQALTLCVSSLVLQKI